MDFPNGPQVTQVQQWVPPSNPTLIRPRSVSWYRWNAEGLTRLASPPNAAGLAQYDAASVFCQEDNGTLLGVRIDATSQNLSVDLAGRWQPLHFVHERLENGRFYSYLDTVGASPTTAARQPGHIIPQLLPPSCQSTVNGNLNAGLIGRLTLLIALAGFSGPPQRLNAIIEHGIRLRRWVHHDYQHGRSKYIFTLLTNLPNDSRPVSRACCDRLLRPSES